MDSPENVLRKKFEERFAKASAELDFSKNLYPLEEIPKGIVVLDRRRNRYQIIERLQQDAYCESFSALYLAKNTSTGIKYHIKFLKPFVFQSKRSFFRCLVEIECMMKIQHPNIVRYYDWSVNRRAAFIVLEHVEPRSVKNLIELETTISPVTATSIVLRVSNALICLEEHHTVHRDIKPYNIAYDYSKNVKLRGFDLVNMTNCNVSMTPPGIVLGTPYYMSPEYINGYALDVRSDIYSLGASLFHMVTGDYPFNGKNTSDIMQQRFTQTPNPKERCPNLPVVLCDLIQKMMAPRPQDRPCSARNLSREMGNVLKVLQEIEYEQRLRSRTYFFYSFCHPTVFAKRSIAHMKDFVKKFYQLQETSINQALKQKK